MTPVSRSVTTKTYKRSEVPRPPLRSLRELAEEFGVSWHSLKGHLQNDPEAPKPYLKHNTNFSSTNTWYKPKEVRTWWASKKK